VPSRSCAASATDMISLWLSDSSTLLGDIQPAAV
jgi:hypothetical protein